MVIDVIPVGTGIAAPHVAIDFLCSPERIKESARVAQEWVLKSIQEVRDAGGKNPYKGADDETIARVILEMIETKKVT